MDLAKQIAESANKIGESANKTAENYEQQLIEYLSQNERINAGEAKALLELGASRAREVLSDMVAKNILVKIGKTRGVYFMKDCCRCCKGAGKTNPIAYFVLACYNAVKTKESRGDSFFVGKFNEKWYNNES